MDDEGRRDTVGVIDVIDPCCPTGGLGDEGPALENGVPASVTSSGTECVTAACRPPRGLRCFGLVNSIK